MARTPYFRSSPNDPPALRATVSRQVRFEEVDPLGIVWHGRYASYFDDARVALGDRYGFGYMDLLDGGVLTPVRQLHVDYLVPLSFPETFTVEAILHWTEAARLDHEFVIRRADGKVAATGYSVQLMLDGHKNLLMLAPPFVADLRRRWRAGELTPVAAAPAHTAIAERVTAWHSE